MSIIAICGFQGSGKDTLADILVNNYGYTRVSFAGAVKDVAAVIFSWDREMLEGRTKESREKREEIDEWCWQTFSYHPREGMCLTFKDEKDIEWFLLRWA